MAIAKCNPQKLAETLSSIYRLFWGVADDQRSNQYPNAGSFDGRCKWPQMEPPMTSSKPPIGKLFLFRDYDYCSSQRWGGILPRGATIVGLNQKPENNQAEQSQKVPRFYKLFWDNPRRRAVKSFGLPGLRQLGFLGHCWTGASQRAKSIWLL